MCLRDKADAMTLNRRVREGDTSAQTWRRSENKSCKYWGKNSECKGPGAEVCFIHLKNSGEARVAGAEGWVAGGGEARWSRASRPAVVTVVSTAEKENTGGC